MRSSSIMVSGRVVRCALPVPAAGAPATITQDDDSLTIVSEGSIRGQWDCSRAIVHTTCTYRTETRTPPWAIALGIMLLPVFLLGLPLFFVKVQESVPVMRFTVVVDDEPVLCLEHSGAEQRTRVPVAP